MSTVDEKTKVAVGLLIPLIGGLAWLVSIDARGRSTADAVSELQKKQDKVSEMAIDVAVIKMQLQEINKKLDTPVRR